MTKRTKGAIPEWLADYRQAHEQAEALYEQIHDQYAERCQNLLVQAGAELDLDQLERIIRAMPSGYWRMELRRVWRERGGVVSPRE